MQRVSSDCSWTRVYIIRFCQKKIETQKILIFRSPLIQEGFKFNGLYTPLQLDKSSWPSQSCLCAGWVKDREHNNNKTHCQLQADILEVRSLGRWICMVLEWTPEEASLLQDRPFSAAASVYISRQAWETQNHQTFSSISQLCTLGPGDTYLQTSVPFLAHNSSIARLSGISGMDWWNGIVERNTGMTFYPKTDIWECYELQYHTRELCICILHYSHQKQFFFVSTAASQAFTCLTLTCVSGKQY